MNRIQSISIKMESLFQALFWFTPILVIAYWSCPDWFHSIGIKLFEHEQGQVIQLNRISQLYAFCVTLIPTSILMYGLCKLRKLFDNYAKGAIFSQQNVLIYKKLGQALFLLAASSILTKPLLSLALSFQNPVGQRFISIGFGTTEISFLITGFLVLTISRVMFEAHKLEDEAKFTV